MRYTYWHKHPRNFGNECSMLKASTREQMCDLAERGYERMSVPEARRHIAWINGENAAWGSNAAIGAMRFADVPSVTQFDTMYS